jgi:hypothetical protein
VCVGERVAIIVEASSFAVDSIEHISLTHKSPTVSPGLTLSPKAAGDPHNVVGYVSRRLEDSCAKILSSPRRVSATSFIMPVTDIEARHRDAEMSNFNFFSEKPAIGQCVNYCHLRIK